VGNARRRKEKMTIKLFFETNPFYKTLSDSIGYEKSGMLVDVVYEAYQAGEKAGIKRVVNLMNQMVQVEEKAVA